MNSKNFTVILSLKIFDIQHYKIQHLLWSLQGKHGFY